MSASRSLLRQLTSRPGTCARAAELGLLPGSSRLVHRLASRSLVRPAAPFPPIRYRHARLRFLTDAPTAPQPPPRAVDGAVQQTRQARRLRRLRNLALFLALVAALYETYPPFRHVLLAGVRCARLMRAVLLAVWDYKQTFAREAAFDVDEPAERAARLRARSECHLRAAGRLLEALKRNSGIYVKLGQHVAAVQVLPVEWTATMRPLQDQCTPTDLAAVDAMLRSDLGAELADLFADFEPKPIGVASLAQVHRATDRRTGRRVAVKVQHADLQEFAAVDMATVNAAIGLVKWVFPEFEFGWLGEEMNEMLPVEMDFTAEAANSARCRANFVPLRGKTSLYLPEILWAEKRVLVMEYIDGARIDDLAYLRDHAIDRNQVSQELARVFSQMVYLDGYFHADPHHGNLLIRPRAPGSASPFNFDLVLLDHGQYFDIPDDLRVNYARFWLSLMAPTSARTIAERKKYAKLVGNIDDDMYPILESAITGRIGVTDLSAVGSPNAGEAPSSSDGKPMRQGSLLDGGAMSNDEVERLRVAMMEREGLIVSIFELLRTVPRRLLMILKLSDLQRSLDFSLATTHGDARVFLIVGQYCAKAVFQSEVANFRAALGHAGLSFALVRGFAASCLAYAYRAAVLGTVEWGMDVRARLVKLRLWIKGLEKGGLRAAGDEMAGLRARQAA
ncbi:hypothetical protein Q5752_002126 [Cryptotrichosporon argae]